MLPFLLKCEKYNTDLEHCSTSNYSITLFQSNKYIRNEVDRDGSYDIMEQWQEK